LPPLYQLILKKILPIIIVLILASGVYLWRINLHEIHSSQIFRMDTIIELKAQGDHELSQKAFKAAMDELRRIDDAFGYRDSLVSRLNSSLYATDRELYRLIERSLEMNRLSNGGFSITLRPVLDVWGFSGTHPYSPPSPETLKSLPRHRTDKVIHLHEDRATVTIDEGVMIDLGAIAKGYAADMAARAIKDCGVETGLVNAGGDIRTFGDRLWKIGIKNPRSQGIIATIPIKDKAIATSGDYERFFIDSGRRYCHIIDPETYKPATGRISVTVVAQNCMDADAWATALFVKGIDPLRKTLKDKGIQWIVIDARGDIQASHGLKGFCPEKIQIGPAP